MVGAICFISFWKGLFTSGDDSASMAKTMAWLTFAMIGTSWFYFPDRSISELSLVFGGQLAYVYGGKHLHHKRVLQHGPAENHEATHDQV